MNATTITIITISPELERIAAAKAISIGVSLQQFAEDAIRRVAELPDPWELFSDVREEIAAGGITDEELTAQIEAAVKEVGTRNSER